MSDKSPIKDAEKDDQNKVENTPLIDQNGDNLNKSKPPNEEEDEEPHKSNWFIAIFEDSEDEVNLIYLRPLTGNVL